MEPLKPQAPKPGYATTEFWGKTLVQLVMLGVVIANELGVFDFKLDPAQVGQIQQGLQSTSQGLVGHDLTLLSAGVMGLVEMAYALSRGSAKRPR